MRSLFFGFFVFFSCASPPDYPIEPVIEFVSLSKDTIEQNRAVTETTRVTIGFTDGDGDIGSESGDSDTSSIFIYDPRQDFLFESNRILFVGLEGVGRGISGEITFTLPKTCCIFELKEFNCEPSSTTPFDRVVFEVYIRDRANHFSNTVELAPIYVKCN